MQRILLGYWILEEGDGGENIMRDKKDILKIRC